jgi:UDP-N-acetylglucosamine diphosphorylase/glucosamine-1-phosphate N-acetyltransferase
MMNKVGAIILAAGKGTRMKSSKPKVAFRLGGKSLIERVVETALDIDSTLTCVVVGYKKEIIMELVDSYKGVTFAEQKEQLGTGHAVKMAKEAFADFEGDVFILCGDVPLTKSSTLKEMLEAHRASNAACTVLTHVIDDPARYGRIIRDENGNIDSIVEFKDANDEQRAIREINTGIYCFNKHKLFDALEKIDNNNAQNEYYLPDTLKILNNAGEKVGGHILEHFVESAGINSQKQLAELETEFYTNIKEKWMTEGVTIQNPSTVIIGEDVIIERDVVIGASTIIEGKTTIKEGSDIGPFCLIRNSLIDEEALLEGYNIIVDSHINEQEVISLRETVVEENVVDE